MLHDFFICLIPQGFVINGAKKATTKANEKITFLTLFQEETSKKMKHPTTAYNMKNLVW